MDSWEESRIRQLLQDAAVSDTRAAEDFLLQLQQVLQSLPRRRLAACQLEPASKVLLAEAAAVYRVRNEEARVEFQAPEKIVIVGSFLLRTAVRDDHNVDLAVLIPPACLYEKDYRDFRYHDRRLLYLVELARALQASGKFEWLRFGELWETASERPETDPPVRKPVLFLQPRQQSFVLRVMPVIQRGQFDARKLRPERGNLRSAAPNAATPLYNRSITDDMAPMDDLVFCHEAAEKFYGFRDLVRLLKLWRNNRGLSRYDGGPELRRLRSSHYLTMQMARLVHADRIPPRATVRHALHVAFAALAAEGDRHGFALREVQAALAATESPLAAVDEAGGLLPSLFTNSVEPIGHFDMLLVLRPADAASAPSLRQEVSRMAALWEAALGDRVTCVVPLRLAPNEGDASCAHAVLGVCLNGANAYRLVDRHPDERLFGGEKVELRRFKTGEVLPAIVWATRPQDRMEVPMRIVRHVLRQHFPQYHVDSTMLVLERAFLPRQWHSDYDLAGQSVLAADPQSPALFDAECLRLQQTLGALANLLMARTGEHALSTRLPLNIVAVRPTARGGEALRRTAVAWPRLQRGAGDNCVAQAAVTACVEFESSREWPGADADAAVHRAVRVAFAIAIGKLLQRAAPTMDGGDSQRLAVQVNDRGELHVIMDDFPICLQLQTPTDSATVDASARLHAQLSAVSHRHVGYGGACRLVKRFMAAHFLLDRSGVDGLAVEAVDLMVARLFTAPQPFAQPPCTAFGGLVRFLHLFAKMPVGRDGSKVAVVLLVPNLSEDENANALLAATATTCTVPLRLCTADDPAGTRLTSAVAAGVVRRLCAVARAALKHLAHTAVQEANMDADELGAILRPPPPQLFGDLVIELNAAAVPHVPLRLDVREADMRRYRRHRWMPAAGAKLVSEQRVLVAFDPVESFTAWLRCQWGKLLVFLRDIYGGTVIAGTWRDAATASRPFSLVHAGYSRPVRAADSRLAVNVDEMVHEIYRAGEGMVRSVRVVRKPTTSEK